MDFTYPARVAKQPDGAYLVTFRDVPEALTDGATREDALQAAEDALLTALAGYVNARASLPVASARKRGERLVTLPPLASAKLALYRALTDAGLTRVALAAELGASEGAVRRLLDLDHRSHIGQVEAALTVLGKRLVVSVEDAA